ncbi:DinB family protein [Glycomyces albidus]|uniref:DinB family protein n=1 Tax=Glycomyces albidus TaxID=2656774 RepID=A0A6L5GBE2_9ACTN|nr:DinB family protein [Glycomyces albidus]MQM26900.1 DinB family protein [Glycomyces albidus]
MAQPPTIDREALHAEMERARTEFHRFLGAADAEALRRRTDGTRWTNEQMLFHMLFGYFLVRALRVLVVGMDRAPRWCSRSFAGALNATTRPFHTVNYLASCAGATVIDHRRAGRRFDRTVAALHRRLDAETDTDLARGMHFPPGWDPFFKRYMTLAELYHYATVHFDFHQRQLTIDRG